jgi:isoleucyl-tRNA synthetase
MNSKEIKDSLLLPKTTFSQRFDPEILEKIFEFWETEEVYRLSLEKNKNKNGNFIVHDGPPYANGSIHLGHLVNRILKDIIIRFHNSLGFYTPFLLGWDTHGLPIEFQVLNRKEKVNSDNIRNECRKYANEQIEIQKNQLKKLGIFTDYRNFYSTQDRSYEAIQIRILNELSKRNIIYRGLRPIYWSWSHKTALAENELEYFDKEDFSLFFKLNLGEKFFDEENVKLLLWTTQPWTVPANMLVAVKSTGKYLLIEFSNEKLIISINFLEKIKKLTSENIVIRKTFDGVSLVGLTYIHPYYNKKFFIVDGDQLVLESEGTGILHIAPSCGPEDFLLAKKENIEVISFLDECGRFTKDFPIFELVGTFYQEANKWVIDDLNKREMITKIEKITHSYPHDWRDKTPLVYRLTEQWFMNLKDIRNEILTNIEKVEWFPHYSKEKMILFIKNRDDWCISRQRKWGVPIPALKINNKLILHSEILEYVAEKTEEIGSDFWFEDETKQMLLLKFPDLLDNSFELSTDTLDVWFDSGVSSFCVLKENEDWPADLYLEGKDQFRGWFNSSLIISTIIKNNPPYKKVVSHGFVVDNNGKKMSKSLGNIIDPLQIINKYGIDTIRLWVSSVDFAKEIKISDEIIKGINDSYQKIRNTFRFILGNLNNINEIIKSKDDLKQELNSIDYYILSYLWQLVLNNKENYLKCNFNAVYNSLNSFCINKLSSFYFEIIKDNLYCDHIQSKRRKQIVITLYFILELMLKMILPIMPFLADEIYQNVNIDFSDFFSKKSVQLVNYPSNPLFIQNRSIKKIENEVEKYFIALRKEVFRLLEKARQEKTIEANICAKVVIKTNEVEQIDFLEELGDLNNMFLVSEIFIIKSNSFSIEISTSDRKKCERCWKFELLKENKCERCQSIFKKL